MNLNLDKYNNVFSEAFGINLEIVNTKLEYNTLDEWDSVGHMNLIVMLEEAFDILIEPDDIIDFVSYDIGIDILLKYNINIK